MKNCHISLHNVDVDFTIYGVTARSMKHQILRATTGGAIHSSGSSRVVVSALQGINLEITRGERIGLIGHNGAGKTTLLRVLAGAYEPVRGSIERVGRTASLFDLSYGFDPYSTGYENILIRGLYLGLDRRTVTERRDEIANFSELGGYLSLPINTYSSGMLMRLAFSISTCISPDIMLMDEWLVVGDATFQEKAQARMLDLVGSAGILVMATHSMSIMEKICSRLIWLDAGRVVADGPYAEVAARFAE